MCKISVIERHGRSGERRVGFVGGLGFDRPAALATTVAHDSHNLVVLPELHISDKGLIEVSEGGFRPVDLIEKS